MRDFYDFTFLLPACLCRLGVEYQVLTLELDL
jgi:hypothetical protein